jgi:hypothetical protein
MTPFGTPAITSARKESAADISISLEHEVVFTSLSHDSLVIIDVLAERFHHLQELEFLALDSCDVSCSGEQWAASYVVQPVAQSGLLPSCQSLSATDIGECRPCLAGLKMTEEGQWGGAME